MTWTMSARVIKNHVKEGLRLADEYGIPQVVKDFIATHHGNSRVEYFYRQALAEAKDLSEIDETAFKYPGPKPHTKETGILMICESIEAAVRSIKEPDIIKIEEMIDRIIKKKLDEGQLDECPLTLDELRRIKGEVNGTTGMLPILRGIFHIRIEYPEEQNKPAQFSRSKLMNKINVYDDSGNLGLNERISRKIAKYVLKSENNIEYAISIIFGSKELLRNLKQKYFNIERTTDVIAFRINDYDENNIEGEIYICPQVAQENADIYKVCIKK